MTCTEAMNAVALREVLQALVSEGMLLVVGHGYCPFCPAVIPDLRHNEKCALLLAQEELERTA